MSATIRVGGIFLERYAAIGALEDSTIWRTEGYSGDYEASWTWAAAADFDATWLRTGSVVEILESGRVVWAGNLAQPEPGEPWQMRAYGSGAQTRQYRCPDPAASNINASILAAQNAGMGWGTGRNDFTTGGYTLAAGLIPIMLDTALDRLAAAQGKVWWVSRGVGSLRAEATAVSWVLDTGGVYLGTTDEELVNDLVGFYVTTADAEGNATDWALTGTVTSAVSIAKHTRHQAVLDLTALGVLFPATANQIVVDRFAQLGARMAWTTAFEVNDLNTRDAFNGVRDAMSVRAGDRLRLLGLTDMRSGSTYRTATEITAGKVTRRHTERTVTVEPVGFKARDFAGALAAAQPPPTEMVLDLG